MDVIVKDRKAIGRANFQNYEALREGFTWDDARALLDGLPGGGLNIAHEAIDRHVDKGHGGKTAIRWIAKDEGRHDFTYADLKDRTSRFANVLQSLGISKGDRVYALLGRVTGTLYLRSRYVAAGCCLLPDVFGVRTGAG